MNLDVVKVLASGATGMLDGSVLGPLEGYAASSAGALGVAWLMLGEQMDQAAAMLTEEHASLRALFAQAAPRADGALGERLAQAAAGRDDDLRIRALQATNHALRGLLIELHAWAEQGGAAAGIEDAVWSELVRSTERRRVALGPF